MTSWITKSAQPSRFYLSVHLKIRRCLLAPRVTSSSLWISAGLLVSWWRVTSWYKTLCLCNNNFIEHLWERAFTSSSAAWFYIFQLPKWHMLQETNTESSRHPVRTLSCVLRWRQAGVNHDGQYQSAPTFIVSLTCRRALKRTYIAIVNLNHGGNSREEHLMTVHKPQMDRYIFIIKSKRWVNHNIMRLIQD